MLSALQPLDVNVVTWVTEFYTYRKAMMDCLRAIAAAADAPERRRYMHVQMIYMQFLMFESARRAIGVLVEFEPNRAESLVNILCSELVVYGFLAQTFPADDYRGARLQLRMREYQEVVPALYRRITEGAHPTNWDRARTTAPEMMRRYRVMCEELSASPRADLAVAVVGPAPVATQVNVA